MSGWVGALAELVAADQPAVLVTVLTVEGSAPREAGTKMVVTRDAIHGTIGGGHLEFTATDIARDLIASRLRPGNHETRPVVRDFPLGPALGQCCGGAATLLFEPILPPSWHIALFGAGHVGAATMRLLGGLACRVTWIDSRQELLAGPLPANVRARIAEAPETVIEELPPGAHLLVMTHSHALDLRIVEQAMRWEKFGFLGLIGSATKRARFISRLAKRDIPAAMIARLTCPIGIDGIDGKEPAEIALAITAQLLRERDARRAVSGLDASARAHEA